MQPSRLILCIAAASALRKERLRILTYNIHAWRDGDHVDRQYYKCWENLPNNFDPDNRGTSDAADLGAWRAEAAAAAGAAAGANGASS